MKSKNTSSILKALVSFLAGLAGTSTGGLVYSSFKDSNFKARFKLKADISFGTPAPSKKLKKNTKKANDCKKLDQKQNKKSEENCK